jgi:serine/threonine-protein kinase
VSDESKTTSGKRRVEEPAHLPPLPGSSRIDTLPEDFFKLLTRRPYLIGDVVGERYKLQQHLGDGGMGQVFVALNQTIGSTVAIKVLKPELLLDASFRKRFQREAEAIAALNHRNVVRFFDLVVGDPTFLVMEHVPGPTLASVLIEEERVEPARAVRLAVRLCWALDAAHRLGIVHRDITPGNVILAADPESGEEPKLIDFGLAKAVVPGPEEALTRTGQIVGTPLYMSPEQIANRDVDARSDVYSLGCLLYHMLEGRPPFSGKDDMSVLYQQVHEPAPPLDASFGRPLGEVVARMLAKDREARFANMRELAAALGAVERRAASVEREAAPPPRRARSAAILLSSALAGALAVALPVGLRRDRAAPAAAGGAAILISSQPAGATVELDGRTLAETTPTIARPVTPGAHRLRLTHAGHGPFEQTLTVAPDARISVEAALPEATRALDVETVPSGALVYLDGHLIMGHTPIRIELTFDDFHQLRVEKPGYEILTHAVKPEDAEPRVSLNLEPERRPRGYLWVDANRAASVFVDGVDTGLLAPTVAIRVSTGAHRVELRDGSGAVSAATQVKVAQGETVHVTLEIGK